MAAPLGGLIVALIVFTGSPTTNATRTVPARLVPAAGDEPVYIADGNFFLVHLRAGEGTDSGFGTPGPAGLLALADAEPRFAADPAGLGQVAGGDPRACAIPWRPSFVFNDSRGWFRDPCWGSTFTRAGVRVFGPSPIGMLVLPVIVLADGAVRVDLANPILGADNTLLTVPYP